MLLVKFFDCVYSIPALRVAFEHGLQGQISEVACHIALQNPHIGKMVMMTVLIEIQCIKT